MANGWTGNIKKIGDVYWCRFKHGGKEYHRSTGKTTIPAAQKWLVDFRETLGKAQGGGAQAPSVALLLELWKAEHKHLCGQGHIDGVERSFRLYLIPEFGDVRADEVTTQDITRIRREFLAGTTDKGRPHTKHGANAIHRNLRLVFKWAVAEKLIQEMPWEVKGLKVQRKPKDTLSADAVEGFLKVIDRAKNPHVRLAVRAQLFMGLRESESLHLRLEWFTNDFSGYTPGKWLAGEFKSKGGEAVILPLPDHFQAMLKATLGDRTPPYVGFVIPAEDGQPHRGQYTKKAILRAGKAVGVANLTPHNLRRTCATLLARLGVSVTEIQALLRHKHISTTISYIETNFVAVQAAQKSLFSPGGTKEGTTPPGTIMQKRITKTVKRMALQSHNL